MMIPFLISKIHRAVVTSTDKNYHGSISIDTEIMEAAKLREFQKVEIYNIDNGNRFSTYVIPEEKGSGEIKLNGAAAHLVRKDDKIIIAAYALIDEKELNSLNSIIVLMKEKNKIDKIIKRSL